MNGRQQSKSGAIAAVSRTAGVIGHAVAMLRHAVCRIPLARSASQSVDRHLAYHHLLESFGRPGCPICSLLIKGTTGRFDTLFREMVNDPEIRLRIRGSLGFCKAHTLLAKERGTALGLALIYEDLTEHAVDRLMTHRDGGRARPLAACPACEDEAEDEAVYVRTLADYLMDSAVQTAYAAGDGLCIRHLEMLMGMAAGPTRKLVIERESARLRALAHDLREYIRKSDYRFAGEPMGAERDSWVRAIAAFIGSRDHD